jgi:methylated-DNA-[protein]-cysteine S-methyltransferase
MTPQPAFTLSEIPTPIGAVLVATDDQGRLRILDWKTHADRMHRLLDRLYGADRVSLVEGEADPAVVEKLKAFFAGDVTAIDDIPTETGGTPFQREVWAALRQIPAGETWSYGRLASHIGRPDAVRAVGAAIGANPIGVVAPCHRVIGADGSLTGYGGGLERKQWLLRHEGARFKSAA